jgi:hypothetical protein
MTQVSEVTEYASAAHEAPKRSNLKKGVKFAILLLKNSSFRKKLRKYTVMGPDEERWVRPPRAYELPEYREGMKRCTSNEKYLRPTRWCNPREPLVIAMANELGAYELSDWEFADAAYWWVKTNLISEILPLDSMSATLRRGTGTCMHATSLWIALCRAAGIKARYKELRTMMNEAAMGLDATQILDLDETEQATLQDLLNVPIKHALGEACIDGQWVVADPGHRVEHYAQYGAPVLKLGEDAAGLVLTPIPGKIRRFESLPLRVGITMRLQTWLAPVAMERGNITLSAPLGKKIIKEAGGIEAYDRNARRRRDLYATDEIKERITRLTQDAKQKTVVEFRENK